MSVSKRLSKVFKNSKSIPFNNSSKIIIMSDCHRGDGSWGDTFSKNQNVFYAALNHYYNNGYTYIELGDGDELWENKNPKDIINEHGEIFWLMSQFNKDHRLYLIYGNHDICKRFFIPEGLILCHEETRQKIFLVHGHQGDFLNDNIWKISRFLVRYFWKPLEVWGIKDPTSTAKNYIKKDTLEKEIISWVKENNQMLIAGHTHRPTFPATNYPPYFNDGSCVHPRGITGIEISNGEISLVKWNVKVNSNGFLFVDKDILAGPNKLIDYLPLHQRI